MKAICIGSRREVCWDEALIESSDGMQIVMHKPEYRGDALICDKSWEGNVCGYFSLIHDDDKLRLYYRGMHWDVNEDATDVGRVTKASMCCAMSSDGKTFERINAAIVEKDGSFDNNVITDQIRDNMFFFKDENPDCPIEAKYKALAEVSDKLWLFESADGVHFEKKRILVDDGAYDSLNVCFWNPDDEKYYLFYRGVHGENTVNGQWTSQAVNAMHTGGVIRDIRMRTSSGFVNWDTPKMLNYGEDAEDLELYTNNVQRYYRAPHMYIGFPTRYIDRYEDEENFPLLPDCPHRERYIKFKGRTGTVMTDTAIMTSRDGVNFRRTDEAFMTPGVDNGRNWYYGDGYLCYGMAQTESEIKGEPDEISIYMPFNYRAGDVVLRRYAVRLDGFFSFSCGFKGGKIITKPITFSGSSLSINFATSALGHVNIRILDVDGRVIPGYDSKKHFGDSVDREIKFSKSLSYLEGIPVRLEITMKDAHLYSFQFSKK